MRIDDFDLRDLHDAVLQKVSVKWGERASVEFHLQPNEAYIKPSRPVVLKCEGFVRLVCPQENPWGPSDIVNGATVEDVADVTCLSFEMQSGDVIVIEGGSFDITVEGGGYTGT